MTGKISGQLFFRDQGIGNDGRRLVMVIGVVAFPTDVPLKFEHQYMVLGTHDARGITFSMPPGYEAKPDEFYTRGNGASGLITAPIWRV